MWYKVVVTRECYDMEWYEVEAASEGEALQKVLDGEEVPYDVDTECVNTEHNYTELLE